MRNTITFILIVSLFCFVECRKHRLDSNGLPPATQQGKNTLGFLLNGEPWTPKGFRGTANLSIDFDPGYKNGIFGIVAYNFIPTVSEQLTIGIRDSLNFITAPKSFPLSRSGLYVISYSKSCDYFSTLIDVQSTGALTITKLDRSNRIISGTFEATLSKAGCDTIRITEGRFDMKF